MIRYLIGIVLLAAALSGCQSSGCEKAKTETENLLKTLCDDVGYKDSPFCSCCVAHGYYSVDDDCTCRPLTFDTASCFYSKEELATPQARQAIEYANSICSVRGAALPYPPDEPAHECRAPSATATDSGSGGSTTSMDMTTSADMTTSSASATAGAGGGGAGGGG